MKTLPTKTKLLTVLCGLGITLLTGCGEKESSSTESPKANAAVATVLSSEVPTDAISVAEARKTAAPGATITVTGKVGGAVDPFVEGFATTMLLDHAIKTCEQIPEDECPTPWDACCEDPSVLSASRLTIQVLGEDGRPLGQTLAGEGGLKGLDELIVTGVVDSGSNENNLILNVTSLAFAKPEA